RAHGRSDLLGRTADRAAELQRDEPVAMYCRRHVRRAALETGAHTPPELAMRLHARPVELCPRGQDDIPLDAPPHEMEGVAVEPDRKSTRLNSSHQIISYAVFCLKKKN